MSAVVSKPDGYGPARYFTTAAEFTSITGLTPAAIYLGTEASGNRADVMGGTSLAANGTPAYQRPVGDALGIEYPGAVSGHRADVNAPGLTSFWNSGFIRVSSSIGSLPGYFGRMNAAFNWGWAVYQQGAFLGTSTLIRDGVSSLLLASAFGFLVPDQTYLAQIQVDRAAAKGRTRWSPIGGGEVYAAEGSIAGFGTLDTAGQLFGSGSFTNSTTGNNAVGRLMFATGAQCEGSNLLASMAAAFEVE